MVAPFPLGLRFARRLTLVIVCVGGWMLPSAASARSAPSLRSELQWLEVRADAPGIPDSADFERATALVERVARMAARRMEEQVRARTLLARLWYRARPSDRGRALALAAAALADRESTRVSVRARLLAHTQVAEAFTSFESGTTAIGHARVALRLGTDPRCRLIGIEPVWVRSVIGWAHMWALERAAAESLCLAALDVGRALGLSATAEYGVALERYGIALSHTGSLERSFLPIGRAAALLDSVAGRLDERTLRARSTHANRLRMQGRSPKVIRWMQSDLDATARPGLMDSPARGWALWSLAGAYGELGDTERELATHREFMALVRRAEYPDSILLAESQLGFAEALARSRRPDEAAELFGSILGPVQTWSAGSGIEHIWPRLMYVSALIGAGRLDAAKSALAAAERSLPLPLAPDDVHERLAADSRITIAWVEGDTAIAGDAEQELDIIESIAPPTDQGRLASARFLLECMLWAGSERAIARRLSATATQQRKLFSQLVPHLLEGEIGRILRRDIRPLDLLLSWSLDGMAHEPEALPEVYAEALRHRGLVRALYARRASLAGDPDSVVSLRADIARRILRATEGGGATAEVDSLREVLRGFERARRSEAFADGVDAPLPALPAGSALVSYFRYERTNRTRGPSVVPRPRTSEYMAFVRRAGAAVPAVVTLGLAGPIDSLAQRWSELMRAGGDRAAVERTGVALRERVWDPVARELGRAERVYVVLDGPLVRVNLAALRGAAGRYLVEENRVLHLLADERDLSARETEPTGAGALALGGLDYSREATGPGPANAERDRAARPGCRDLMGYRFAPLPASGDEVRRVARTLARGAADTCAVATGDEGSEGYVRERIAGRRWVHLATHAFFIAEDCAKEEASEELVRRNPLVFSGIALAGANHHATAPRATDDGLLTGEEICGLDLRGVEWLVLSGCETGLGMTERWENVDGLRRAVREAGARTTIMSLWPVDDEAAAEWMESLYRARFERGQDTALAVRTAMRETLRDLRRAHRDPDPRRWAAFVAVGE